MSEASLNRAFAEARRALLAFRDAREGNGYLDEEDLRVADALDELLDETDPMRKKGSRQ